MLAVSKTEFARLSGVTQSRVSQWISEGKITADAIEGEGRFARIRVDAARDQLKLRIDPTQRVANGLNTRLDGATLPGLTPPPADPVNDSIKAERLRSLQYNNRRAAEEELARRGIYVRADQTAAAMTKLAGGLMNVFEGALGDLAQAVAAKWELPARDVLHLLRQEFRAVRTAAAGAARQNAEAMAPLIEDLTDPESGFDVPSE